MNFYEKNVEHLRTIDPLLVEALEKYDKEKTENVDVKEGEYGYPVLTCEKDGLTYNLSSAFDGEGTYESIWMQQFEDLGYEGYLIHFGMARISYLEKVQKEREEFFQFFYEPSVEVFRALMEWTDLTFIGEKIGFVVKGLNDDKLRACLYRIASSDHLPHLKYLCMPNYDKLFPEDFKEMMKLAKKVSAEQLIDEQTMIRFSTEIARNRRNNLMYVARSKNLQHVWDNMPKGKPGIVVSAGPSLNKNIDELKNAVGKALIVATDTALKPLLNHGITPDVFSTVDPSKPLVLFDRDEVWEIPMVIPEDGNVHVVEKHKGTIFFTNIPGDIGSNYYVKFGKQMQWLESGGSVANDAFSFAKEAGCNPIILVGQDLAYTNGRSHADGTFKDKMDKFNTDGDRYFEIEGIDGKPVITGHDFKLYLEWFEAQIEKFKDEVKVIDATEGGAKIHGAELMTLKEAVEKYCVDEFDARAIIDAAPLLFDEEEKKKIDEELIDMYKQLQKLKKKVKRGISEYETLIFRAKRGEMDKEFKSSFKRITKMAEKLEDDQVMNLVQPYLADFNYVYKNDLRKVESDTFDGLMELLESGKKYMEKMVETCDKLDKDFKDMVEQVRELQKSEE